ncbi:serine hydrolase domain-containing protein [Plantibacter sp. ME-Dv--P-095]|uniref:serine hydrolase domain-containing protein n=1 Tax=Plantibacter sp. ME-Dv--P-095 TaxID=3040299 RepID=UPI00254F9764|nr:serine hydrolase domain-containing protein [Plantibacter sp. ME-Dv--P-095]
MNDSRRETPGRPARTATRSRGRTPVVLAALIAIVCGPLAVAGTAAGTEPSKPTTTRTVAASLSPEDTTAWLDGLLPAALEREGITGAIVSVVSGGEIVTERGYGLATAGTATVEPAAVDVDRTLFRIGSVSKLMTATAVMQQVEAGVLDLDEPVQSYLDVTLPVAFETPITLRHLLTHTAGFEDQLAGLIASAPAEPKPLRDTVTIDPPEQIFEPGTTPSYSNYSNGLAAYVVERVTGTPFEQYATEHVLTASGMTDATYEQPLSPERRRDMSAGYRFAGSPEVPFEVVSPAPAGAISATAGDLANFMNAQLGHPSADGRTLLTPESLERMHAPALDEEHLGNLANGPRMTLGFFERDRNGHRILSHAGDLTAFHAQLEIYPDDDAGIFISLNSTGVNGDSSTAIRDAVTTGFADRYFPEERSAPRVEETAAAHAAALAGTYQLSRRGESTFVRLFYVLSSVEVAAEQDGVVTISAITDSAGTPLRFVEVEPWVWQEVDGQRRVAASTNGDTVTAVGFDPAFTMQPMPTERALVPTIAAGSLVILVITLLAWPLGALRRAETSRPVSSDRRDRALSWWTRGSVLALIAAAPFWSVVAQALISDGPAPSPVVIRIAQILTALAVLGCVPSVWRAVRAARGTETEPGTSDGRPRRRVATAARVTGSGMTALAFVGLGFVAVVGGLLLPDLSY